MTTATIDTLPDLLSRYNDVRSFSEQLCEPLEVEYYVLQSMTDGSPTKWHLAHTTWFFETFLLERDAGYQPYQERFGYLFNSYYESIGESLRPGGYLEAVLVYGFNQGLETSHIGVYNWEEGGGSVGYKMNYVQDQYIGTDYGTYQTQLHSQQMMKI